MECPKCGGAVELHAGQAAHITEAMIKSGMAGAARVVACTMASCENVYVGTCDHQRAGEVINGEFVWIKSLIPLGLLLRLFAEEGVKPIMVQLPPEQKDLPDQENPQHDPGE